MTPALTVHTCSCGRAYDLGAWERLPLVGAQQDEPYPLELRNCRCGSTRPVAISPAIRIERLVWAIVEADHLAAEAVRATAAEDHEDADDVAEIARLLDRAERIADRLGTRSARREVA